MRAVTDSIPLAVLEIAQSALLVAVLTITLLLPALEVAPRPRIVAIDLVQVMVGCADRPGHGSQDLPRDQKGS